MSKKSQKISWNSLALPGIIGAVVLAGCGQGGPPLAPVTGKVTYNGAPVTEGTLTFAPIAGENPGKPGTGKITKEGTYSVGTNSASDGAAVGKHKILYSAPLGEIPIVEGKDPAPGTSPPRSRFADLVPKTAEVEVRSSSNTIDVELVKSGR